MALTKLGNDESRIQGAQISLFVHLFVLGTQHVALSPEYGMLRSQNGALSASYFELSTSNVECDVLSASFFVRSGEC